jgi:hypothetical protein
VDRTRLTRWLIPLPAILFALTAQTANAEPIPGIETTYYTIDAIPPIQSTTEYPVCGTEIENNINRNYDYELYEDCTYDLFMVHMTGFIDIPEHDTIEFMLATDDGGEMIIDGNTFGNWNDQGCTWMMSGELTLEPGSNAFEVWMYEHGGNSCMMLAWNIDNQGWVIVPDEVFTQQAVAPTTTTSSTTTSSSTTSTSTTTTTTTSSSTTTTSSTVPPPTESSTTTEPVQISTTTSVADTTTSTTTTTEPPYTPTQTSSTIPTIEIPPVTTITEPETIVVVTDTTEPETFTTDPEEITVPETTEPETFVTVPETITVPDTTEPETSTTVLDGLPEDTVEPVETTIPEISVPDDEVQIVPDETEQPTDTTQPQEYTTETTLLEVQDSSTTTLPEPVINEQITEALQEVIKNEPVTNEQVEQILKTLTEAAPEQIVAAITEVLAADITSEQATEIASSPEVLAAITETQAEELFEQIVVEELTEEQLEAFTEAIQEAPTKVKKAFEKTINIFGSQFENYVPTGSNIPVKTRRTLVAAGALIAAIPSTRVRR